MPDRVLGDPAIRQGLADDRLDDLVHILGGELGVQMLGGEHDLRHAHRLAALILHGDLALGIRAKHAAATLALLAGIGEVLEDLVGVEERRRHQLRRFPAGIAKHDALVARAFILAAGGVHALGNVGRLRVQQHIDLGLLPVETVLLVADRLDRLAGGGLHLALHGLFIERGADLAAMTTRFVVASVSQATRTCAASMPAFAASLKNRSTTSSEIRSQTLSGALRTRIRW